MQEYPLHLLHSQNCFQETENLNWFKIYYISHRNLTCLFGRIKLESVPIFLLGLDTDSGDEDDGEVAAVAGESVINCGVMMFLIVLYSGTVSSSGLQGCGSSPNIWNWNCEWNLLMQSWLQKEKDIIFWQMSSTRTGIFCSTKEQAICKSLWAHQISVRLERVKKSD